MAHFKKEKQIKNFRYTKLSYINSLYFFITNLRKYKNTKNGKDIFEDMENKAKSHLKNRYKNLNNYELDKLLNAQKEIINLNSHEKHIPEINIRPYELGDAGYVSQLHGDFYKENYNFDKIFDYYVLNPLTEFVKKPNGSQLWIVEIDGKRAGSIALIKENENTAQLRWFILESHTQGLGIGNKLMKTAINFAKENEYKHIYLWTFSLLKPARHLYEKFGFKVTETKENKEWSDKKLIEERWDIEL